MQRNPPDYFADPPPTAHVRRPRPWPEISGSRQDGDRALEHLLALADANDILVQYTDDKNFTEVGLYDSFERSILLHTDLGNTPGLYVFALAHELAHACDPILHVTEMPYQGTKKADIEALAEVSAIEALREWGLTLRNEYIFVDWTDTLRFFSSGWRERLKSKLYDRYVVVFTPLRPYLANAEAQAVRDQRYRKSLNRVNREANRIFKDQQRKARNNAQADADLDAMGKWGRGAAWKGFKRLL